MQILWWGDHIKKSKYLKIIGNIVMILSFIYIFRVLYNMSDEILHIANFGAILIMCIVFPIILSLSICLLGYAWKMNLEFCSKKKSDTLMVLEIFLKSNLCKYLPGNVMQYASRNLYSEKLGVSQIQMAASSVLEILFSIFASLILCISFSRELFFEMLEKYFFTIDTNILLIAIVIFCIVLLSIIPFLFKKKLLQFENIRSLITVEFFKLTFKYTLIISLISTLSAITLFFILKYGMNVGLGDFYSLLGAYVVSWLVGYITPGSPGGIGVRESILTLFLSDQYGVNNILVAVLVLRAISILADLLAFILFIILKNIIGSKSTREYSENREI